MAKRKTVSKKIRFEVFKRDYFTCQYCGRKPPEVQLEVDHIKPVAKGGTNDILNLITSCADCNRGKRDIELSDDSVIENQIKKLEILQAKNEQMEMMLKWKEELMHLEDKEINAINDILEHKTAYGFNDRGQKIIKKYIKKYGLSEVIDATNLSIENYYFTEDDWETMFKKIGTILEMRAKTKDDPALYIKCKLCKYASKKFANEYDRTELMNMLDSCIVNEENEEELFDVMKKAESYEEVLEQLEEKYFDWDEEMRQVEGWLKENGNQENS